MKDLINSPSDRIEEASYSPFDEAILPLLEQICGSDCSSSPSLRCKMDLVNIHKLTMQWLSCSDTKLDMKISGSF